jgi:hypothetical protein
MTTLWRECQEAWLGGRRIEIPPAVFDEARRRAHLLREGAVTDALLALRRIAGAAPDSAADNAAAMIDVSAGTNAGEEQPRLVD